MNHWARLIDPAAPVPQPSTLQGRVHILADEIDAERQTPASKPGPKPPAIALRPLAGLPRMEMEYQSAGPYVIEINDRAVCVELVLPEMRAVPTKATTATPRASCATAALSAATSTWRDR